MSTQPIMPALAALGFVGGRERQVQQYELYEPKHLHVALPKCGRQPTHNTWNGCVTDRDQNYDTTNDAPVAGSTLYPTEQYASCPASLVGLSNDWTALSNKIDAMQPVGNTNQAIGLQMGWQSLTAVPFTIPAMDPNYQYNQVVIILSDGLTPRTAGTPTPHRSTHASRKSATI